MAHRASHCPPSFPVAQQPSTWRAPGRKAPWLATAHRHMDSRNSEAVMELLRDLHRQGATICMVTHDPRYAEHADRTIHLFDGQVVEESVQAASSSE